MVHRKIFCLLYSRWWQSLTLLSHTCIVCCPWWSGLRTQDDVDPCLVPGKLNAAWSVLQWCSIPPTSCRGYFRFKSENHKILNSRLIPFKSVLRVLFYLSKVELIEMNLSIFTIFPRVHRPFQAARRSLSVSKKFLQTCSVLSLLSNIFHFLVLVNVCSPVSLSRLHRGAEDGFSFTNWFPVKATFWILGLNTQIIWLWVLSQSLQSGFVIDCTCTCTWCKYNFIFTLLFKM